MTRRAASKRAVAYRFAGWIGKLVVDAPPFKGIGVCKESM
jgi:hypothetical protein